MMLRYDEPELPDHVVIRECPVCDYWAEWDTDTDTPV